ncbi:hypothetical protein DPMN_172925 [Dreissena polymorpha]|uniref:Uncharacterized protein n=1 Tax=Dreissena polymorpha TaxID=45954 RepID=A0A9D4E3R4_DREPO|nr:hypothetical protein DPMN_172925 [Dreissena polymorpha]
MPESAQEKFLQGEHVMRHVPGVWYAIWCDMFIEKTLMRYGHDKKGIIGSTLKPETVKVWSLSLYICSRLAEDLREMSSTNLVDTNEKHKEEKRDRINADA